MNKSPAFETRVRSRREIACEKGDQPAQTMASYSLLGLHYEETTGADLLLDGLKKSMTSTPNGIIQSFTTLRVRLLQQV